MTHRIRMITALAVVLALCSTGIGCKSNGGHWYKPTTYSFYNPFKPQPPDDQYGEAERFAESERPSLDSHPNIQTPPGGYARPSELGAATLEKCRNTHL